MTMPMSRADGNVLRSDDGPFTITPTATGAAVTLDSLPGPGDNISVSAGNRTVVFELVEDAGSVAIGRVPVSYPAGASIETIVDILSDVMSTELLSQYVQATVDHTMGTDTLELIAQDDEDGALIGTVDFMGQMLNGVFINPDVDPVEVLSFLNPLSVNGSELVLNTVGGGLLDAWVDFNGDGDFFDADEQVLTNVPVVDGENRLQMFLAGLTGGFRRDRDRFHLGTVPTEHRRQSVTRRPGGRR